jgi:hypothetical protein
MKPNDQSKLPAIEKREAMVRSFVDAVEFLRRRQGLTNVKYLSLFVEPDNDPVRTVPPDIYVELHRLLDRLLTERGLRQEVRVLGSGDACGPPHAIDPWCRDILEAGILKYVDGIASHTYQHRDVTSLTSWIRSRQEAIRENSASDGQKPFWITEFGYSAHLETFDIPEMRTYDYGLFAGDFAIQAMRDGVAGLMIWGLGPVYYDGQFQQKAGLWDHHEDQWRPRPVFYSYSLLCRHTPKESRVIDVVASPQPAWFRSVALQNAAGKTTVLLANRSPEPLPLEIRLDQSQEKTLREYCYSAQSVPTPDQAMLRPVAEYRLGGGQPAKITVPGNSFVLLSDMPE